jgi:hypothetical protein
MTAVSETIDIVRCAIREEHNGVRDFVLKYGGDAYDTAIEWNGTIEGISVYGSTDNIEEDFGMYFSDAEDVFQHFGNDVCAVVETGDFLIRNQEGEK